MLKYFKYSIIVTIAGLVLAYFWGDYVAPGGGLKALLIAIFLGILEVTLSFDNAIINAMRLKKMDYKWQQRFLTWGILIAVFGVRLLFPIVLVAIFSHHNAINVFDMALHNVAQYSTYLHQAHTPLVSFGGMFLGMIFLEYFFDCKRNVHWLSRIEKYFAVCGHVRSISVILGLLTLCFVQYFMAPDEKMAFLIPAISAIITFLIINGVCDMLETLADKRSLMTGIGQIGFINFIYLEVIDASFSFDGLLGAFAISKDVIIITIGLAIGAMFVRSLTIFMVDRQTLEKYIYLEHGAHWAIGFLALVMLVSIFNEVPEGITGGVSLIIIIAAFLSSLHKKKKATT